MYPMKSRWYKRQPIKNVYPKIELVTLLMIFK